MKKVETALISVYHKDGIVEFARGLVDQGVKIYASGGTAKALTDADIEVTDVAGLVGGGAILGHRVVTLSREVHAGLLARDISVDLKELAELSIPFIDLICVDLYPLTEDLKKPDHTRESVIEKTDIGGPTMIRSAAKGGRVVVCDPKDRTRVLEWLQAGGNDEAFVRELAAKGEYTVAQYCLMSATFHGEGTYAGVLGTRVAECKYGENAPQAPAALYESANDDPLAMSRFSVLEGTPPSYNNWADIDRLLQTATHVAAVFAKNRGKVPHLAVGAKHGNACGAAIGETHAETLKKTIAGDPLAIFGGLILTNFPIGAEEAEEISGRMLDGIIAPSFTEEAIAKLRRKGDRCRFIVNPALAAFSENTLDVAPRFRYVRGGFLQQPNYTFILDLSSSDLAKYGNATPTQEDDLLLAWAVGATSNSNTISLVKDGMLIGNGVGQQDRVGAAKLALMRAERSKHDPKGAAAYSDSFFPFPDGPETLIDAGIGAILSTSGSLKDPATIELATARNTPLYLIPDRIGRGFFGH